MATTKFPDRSRREFSVKASDLHAIFRDIAFGIPSNSGKIPVFCQIREFDPETSSLQTACPATDFVEEFQLSPRHTAPTGAQQAHADAPGQSGEAFYPAAIRQHLRNVIEGRAVHGEVRHSIGRRDRVAVLGRDAGSERCFHGSEG